MNKIIEFTNKEREIYGNKLSTIIFSVDEIKNIVPKEKLNIRKYTHGIKLLETYIEMTKEADKKADGKGLFERFKNDDKYKQELIDFKERHKKEFEQINRCLSCSCLKCSHDCSCNPCLSCNDSGKVTHCDDNFVMTQFKNTTLDLDKMDKSYTFNVLAIITNTDLRKSYILLQDKYDNENLMMFYYIKGIEEDKYEGIEDANEIDQVASIYYSINN